MRASRDARDARASWAAGVAAGRRAIVGAALLSGIVTAAVVLAIPRRYEASAMLAAVTSRNLPAGLSGGLAASLLGQASLGGGLQATPAMLVRLARTDGVLLPVGESSVPGADGRVVDALEREEAGGVRPGLVGRAMRKHVAATFDVQTGLLTIRVAHRDSALARHVVDRTIAQLREAFVRASRAQAAQLREAQEARVDSAQRRLRQAEAALVRFDAGNRTIPSYSSLRLERDRLEREVSMAQSVYQQAATEREAAVAKELEATPAVVVLDAPPASLPPVPRGTALKTLLALILGGLAGLTWTLLGLAARRGLDDPDASALGGVLQAWPASRRVAAWLAKGA